MNDLFLSVLSLIHHDTFCFCVETDKKRYDNTIDFGIDNNYDNLEMTLKELPKGCRKKLKKL